MREARGPDHQGQRDAEHVDHALGPVGIFSEPQVGEHQVELLQHVQPRPVVDLAAQAELRDRVARDHEAQEEGRHHVGEDQHAILRDLRVGDALHPAEHGIDENDAHADDHAHGDVDVEEAREHDPHPAHLAGDIGEADEDEADHSDNARGLGIVPSADEIGHGELAELAQVWRKQKRQHDVSAGPAHQVDRAVIAEEGDQARHRDEAGRAHPVSGRGHAVDDRVHPAAGDVEFLRRTCPAPQGDADVECEAGADEEVDQSLRVHRPLPQSSRSYLRSSFRILTT